MSCHEYRYPFKDMLGVFRRGFLMDAGVKVAVMAVIFAFTNLTVMASACVTNAVIFTNPNASILWKTICSDRVVLPVAWPKDAASACLDIKGNNYSSRSFNVTPSVDSCVVDFARPVNEDRETIFIFTLRFLDADGAPLAGETQMATLGFVRGTEYPSSVRCVLGGETAREWNRILPQHMVLPMSEGMTALSLDGTAVENWEAPGWAMCNSLSMGLHQIQGVANGTPLACEFKVVGTGMYIKVQ